MKLDTVLTSPALSTSLSHSIIKLSLLCDLCLSCGLNDVLLSGSRAWRNDPSVKASLADCEWHLSSNIAFHDEFIYWNQIFLDIT